ncbi:Glycogen biosynthesis protein GlgD [Caloramator mitchellensis]|uniref:Glycogen biosynthesis protein GlgD n=2 Tax=Caloramator mitchellensis TaxID=908809 RepID=A0A0R3JV28_CALMK|nr:Glycogen biosynthesis protein GlgD [Caloramator mitchellensis]
MGVIVLNEDESNIRSLTLNRPLASIPIFGRYRVIDFVLSNMVNAGLTNVGIFVETNSRSLVDHIGTGKPWDLNRKIDGLYIFNHTLRGMIHDDIKVFKNNMEYFYRSRKEKVILARSRMIMNINLEKVAQFHEESGADVTIVSKRVKNSDMYTNCDILNLDENGKVLSVGRNIGLDNEMNVSAEVFIMSKEFFIQAVYSCMQEGTCSSVMEYVYKNVQKHDIRAYEFEGYLGCINSVSSYYKVSMDFLNYEIMRELCGRNGNIYTKSYDSPPTKYLNGANVSNSIMASGSIVKGMVTNSIVSRRVIIEEGAEIIDSIIFSRCTIGKNVKLKNVILDKNVIIEDDKVLIGDNKYPIVIEKGSRIEL